MKLTREILRLSLQLNASANEIHRVLDVSRGKVQDILRRAVAAGVEWPLPQDDAKLEALLYPRPAAVHMPPELPDWQAVDTELRRKGMTLRLLWEEYAARHPSGLGYSQFCRRYAKWASQRDLVMRQDHRAGEKLFVDFAGQKVPVVCRFTGEVKLVTIFGAVLGASNLCYAEAFESEGLRDWLAAHVHALRFLGGVPQYVVPDNLKSAVTTASRFDPVLNKSYLRLAEHYGFGIAPARPYRPRDKAKVEKAVQIIEQRILAPIRNMTFFTLDELNKEIWQRLERLNNEPFQKLSGCRWSWFETVDRPALKPLPRTEFEHEEWSLSLKIPKDYHVNVHKHFYSVPYRLVGELVDVRITDTTVEVFHASKRVASHIRNWAEGKKTTADEHMPAEHAAYQGLSSETFLEWSSEVGPATKTVIVAILKSKPQPQLCFDQCWGILRSLRKKYGDRDLEKACVHAVMLQSPTYRLVKTILQKGVDTLPEQLLLNVPEVRHENIRGPGRFK